MEDELKINARGLSSPGPRLMVENALDVNPGKIIRAIVSSLEAAEDLREHFSKGNFRISVDQVGEEYHVFIQPES